MKPSPVYQRIADDLRRKITDGTFPPGAQIPTEADLIERYEVKSRATVRQGLAMLVNEGLIEARRPRGYFVIEHRRLVYRPQAEFRKKPPEVDIFTNLVAEEDGRVPSQDIEVSIIEATGLIRDRLKLKEGSLAAARRRVRRLDGIAYNINDSHVALELVQGSEWMHPGDVQRGTDTVLSELIGQQLVYGFHELYLRMPTPSEVHRLNLGAGVPVAEHISTSFDADRNPIQVTVNIVPGDRHVIVFETHRETENQELPRIPWGAP
ncbi:GntR family transcriptional regulator (plasmid) [Streptomyces sp. NBC_00536]|uniref:GntR family transcriptional regulator n=1 Tax=Streptomyces sp. NBC_00536 TaxID=2975769 RepID=UPI002E81F94B|nr:GntR family transcriptional regulator [Streptomyces sp. NBC_00536]WUC84503.1 GntR family transcriptional regulator [Streptomyces sp. NBC_00536]